MYGLLRSANRCSGQCCRRSVARRERCVGIWVAMIPSGWRSTSEWLPGRRGVGSAPSYCVRV